MMVTAASGRRRRCRAPTTRAIEGARKSRIGQAGAPSKVDRPASPSRSTIRPPISSTGPQFAAAMRYLLNRIQRQPCLTPGFLARPDSRSPPYRGLAMSSNGAPIQDISNTVGHKSTHVTETVYRHVIVPATHGSDRNGRRFDDDEDDADESNVNAKPACGHVHHSFLANAARVRDLTLDVPGSGVLAVGMPVPQARTGRPLLRPVPATPAATSVSCKKCAAIAALPALDAAWLPEEEVERVPLVGIWHCTGPATSRARPPAQPDPWRRMVLNSCSVAVGTVLHLVIPSAGPGKQRRHEWCSRICR